MMGQAAATPRSTAHPAFVTLLVFLLIVPIPFTSERALDVIVTPGRSCAVILERWLVGRACLSGLARRYHSDGPRTAQIVGPGVMERQVLGCFWILAGRGRS